jgi:amidase
VDPATATATELLAALEDRSLSSRELLDDLLGRVDALNPTLGAVVALDAERARQAAAAADEATARGERSGPLHGLPMTMKDVWETEGLATTSGAPELAVHVPTTDALAVGRLKAAGAIVFGKTNTPLYAGDFQTYNDLFGTTNNPWDTSRTAGGSSGGAAVAVSAGLTPLELGSDIGGSIRNPAHYNGVFGLKPSWGVIPSRGHIPGPPGTLVEPDVNCAGPLARGLDDLRTALCAMAGPLPEDAPGWRLELDPGPPVGDVRGIRVATLFDEGAGFLPLAADVRASLGGFAERLAAAGASVEPVALPVPLAEGLDSWQELVLPLEGTKLRDEDFAAFCAVEDVDGDDMLVRAGRALVARHRSWLAADERRQRQRAAWAALFEGYDVVLAPVMPTAAFPHDIERPIVQRQLDVDGTAVPHMVAMAWCGAVGAVLLPVVALPTGRTPSGLPVGVQAVGPFLSDLRLLGLCELLVEAAGPGYEPPPGAVRPGGGGS